MRLIKDTTWTFLTLGVIITALSIGFLIEVGRAEQVRPRALLEACLLSFMSYFTPALWLRWRYRSEFGLAWLTVPTVGTILVLLTVVHIPNEISIWTRSSGETFIVNALEALPNQLFLFCFGLLLYSAISALIIGFVQGVGLSFLALRRRCWENKQAKLNSGLKIDEL